MRHVHTCPLTGCGATPSTSPFASPSYTFDRNDIAAYYDDDAGTSLVFASGNTRWPPPRPWRSTCSPTAAASPSSSGSNPPAAWLLDTGGFYWVGGTELERRPIGNSKLQSVIMNDLSGAPTALAADAYNIYVADTIQVVACPKATGQCGSTSTLIGNVGSPIYLATMPDSSYVWFRQRRAQSINCPYRGCTDPQNIPIWSGATAIQAMVADEAALYWTDTTRGTVMKCAHGTICNTPTTVASPGLNQPWGIAVDGSWVYWTLAAGSVAVQRVAK